jgi:hypothetical protein
MIFFIWPKKLVLSFARKKSAVELMRLSFVRFLLLVEWFGSYMIAIGLKEEG